MIMIKKITKKEKEENIQAIKETIKLDAEDKPVGRIAADIACYLQGKHRADYAPNKEGITSVEISNADKIKLTGKKWSSKIYYHHSGYLGGLKEVVAEDMHKNKPEEILRLAVWGMLPKNRLRKPRIKRLKFV
jgi:large subunit ribosomal protein L13